MIGELSVPGILLTLQALRIAIVWTYLSRLLAPVRRWQGSSTPDDATLLAADLAI